MLAEGHLQWVFCDSNGGLLRRSNFVRREWRTLLEKVNEVLPEGRKLPIRFRFHDLDIRLPRYASPRVTIQRLFKNCWVMRESLSHSTCTATLCHLCSQSQPKRWTAPSPRW